MIPADEDLTPIDPGLLARITADVNAGSDLENLIVPVGQVGDYQIVKLLGVGGYGYVHLALDIKRNNHPVALKLPRGEVLASPELKTRFIQEARAARIIDHPNVVRVLDSGEEGASCYIAMEYCPDGSLGEWLKGRERANAIPPRWVATLVAEIADGVHAAHLLGLLHRDLKPGNVMLVKVGDFENEDAPSFRPKVGDFGLVKVLEEGSLRLNSTVSGMRVGTLAYMSPEQARGDKKIKASSDVYSLGVILFELLTGERPFTGTSEAQLLSSILNEVPARSARVARAGLPRPLTRICQACLAKSPGDRYASAALLADDLRRFLHDETARGMPLWKHARAIVQRHKTRAGAAILLIALVVVGLVASQLNTWAHTRSWLLAIQSSDDLSSLPALLAESPPLKGPVLSTLEEIFKNGPPAKKLKAAIVLAGVRSPCADYAYERMIAGDPQESGVIARMLDSAITGLAGRLRNEVETEKKPGPGEEEEASDQRRANAATALMMIGIVDSPNRLMRFAPNPQARSFFLHNAGRAGITPELMYAQILNHATDAETRPGWIQALGEVPEDHWNEPFKTKVIDTLRQLYRDDPNALVHSSTKWLLRKWGQATELQKMDRQLMTLGQRNGFQWRVSPDLLTFIHWTDPLTNRILEITDTEITCEIFLKFEPDHPVDRSFCPEPDSAITSVTYLDAAKFCGLLDDHEGIAPDQRCYRVGEVLSLEPVPGSIDLKGFRLLTDREFNAAARGQTTTKRYYGDTAKLMTKYVWYLQGTKPRTYPVALLKPNDVGLFDTLGNAAEVCQTTSRAISAHSSLQACNCGGSFTQDEYRIGTGVSFTGPPTSAKNRSTQWSVGFRVARTLQPLPAD